LSDVSLSWGAFGENLTANETLGESFEVNEYVLFQVASRTTSPYNGLAS
jgi:hypothetical protein